MKYAMLGNTGLYVSRFTLGAMTFGSGDLPFRGFKYSVNQESANEMVKMALDAGVNAFDTADVYSMGTSEQILGKAIGNKRKEVVISTKVGNRMGKELINYGGSYGHIISACEASLKRLGTDYIDVYLMHFEDKLTPVEETVRAFDNLVKRGLIRYPGFSNFSAWKATLAFCKQLKHDYARFIAAQMHYSLLNRDIEYELVPFMEHAGIGLQVWSPLAGGFLSGKYTRNDPKGGGGRLAEFNFPIFDRETGFNIVEKLFEIGKKYNNAPPSHIAFAWLLSKKFASTVIIGASVISQLENNLKAADFALNKEDVDELDKMTGLRMLYPNYLYSGVRDQASHDAAGSK